MTHRHARKRAPKNCDAFPSQQSRGSAAPECCNQLLFGRNFRVFRCSSSRRAGIGRNRRRTSKKFRCVKFLFSGRQRMPVRRARRPNRSARDAAHRPKPSHSAPTKTGRNATSVVNRRPIRRAEPYATRTCTPRGAIRHAEPYATRPPGEGSARDPRGNSRSKIRVRPLLTRSRVDIWHIYSPVSGELGASKLPLGENRP